MTVKIKIDLVELNGKPMIRLISPYHPKLPERARALNGKFNGVTKSWYFDVRDEERVRELARQIYGTDGQDNPTLVTLRVKLDDLNTETDTLWLAGRQVAWRRFPSDHVRLGEGVVIVQGGFAREGWTKQSRRRAVLAPEPGTVLEIRDVPEGIAREAMSKNPAAIEILTPRPEDADAETKLKALLDRRDQLRKELDLVEEQIKLLAGLVGKNEAATD